MKEKIEVVYIYEGSYLLIGIILRNKLRSMKV